MANSYVKPFTKDLIMPTITLNSRKLTYNIKYQKGRKTLKLKVASTDCLEITAPSRYPKSDIEKLLYQKTAWIMAQITHLTAIAANPVNQSVTSGTQMLYRGRPYTLAIAYAQRPAVTLAAGQLMIELPAGENRDTAQDTLTVLKKWYFESAGNLLAAKTEEWAARIGVNPTRVKLRDQKTRWGSCSSSGSINYNWRIVMAPPEVIDYLVIHELCHLRVPNHSQEFWQLVGRFSPNFKECRSWLVVNGSLLTRIL